MSDAFWWVALAVFGLAGSAWCSGFETSLYVVNRVRLALRAEASPPDRPARRLRRELDNPDRSITTLLISNNVFNYLGVLGVSSLLEGRGLSSLGVIVINALLVTPALLVFGESVPKEYFRVEADRLAYRFAPWLAALRWLLTIFGAVPALLLVSRVLARFVGVSEEAVIRADARRRVAVLLKEGIGHGLISATQSTLIDRALALSGTQVAQVMVPWRRVAWVRAEWDPDRMLQFASHRDHPRLPALDARGRVAGIFVAHEAVAGAHPPGPSPLREPARLREDMPVARAAELVARSPARIGIVERGGRPLGIATISDLASPVLATETRAGGAGTGALPRTEG